MKVFFPGPVSLGGFATAVFENMTRSSSEVKARYRLDPVDHGAFVDQIGGLRAEVGRKYTPVLGMWSSFVVPKDRDAIELVVGLDRSFGLAMHRAHTRLKTRGQWIVPETMIRTLALGFIDHAGCR